MPAVWNRAELTGPRVTTFRVLLAALSLIKARGYGVYRKSPRLGRRMAAGNFMQNDFWTCTSMQKSMDEPEHVCCKPLRW